MLVSLVESVGFESWIRCKKYCSIFDFLIEEYTKSRRSEFQLAKISGIVYVNVANRVTYL